jgi:colanic acid biosynthesis glycosyl transferase WcaI
VLTIVDPPERPARHVPRGAIKFGILALLLGIVIGCTLGVARDLIPRSGQETKEELVEPAALRKAALDDLSHPWRLSGDWSAGGRTGSAAPHSTMARSTPPRSLRTFLVLSQVYVPDPASVGQHLADAAAELVRRGHRVVVFTSDRGYDDPAVRYPRRELIDGVEVRRIPWASFGKRSLALRLLAGLSFTLQVVLRSFGVRTMDVVLVSTTPPLIPLGALAIGALRRAAIKYWVMDLNPDQLVALGVLRESSLAARIFDWLNRRILERASDVVVLDRFMAERVLRKLDVSHKLTVLPPWPHEDQLEPIEHADNPFRSRHGLAGKLVVMYSGNHGPSNPITTILEAARRVQDLPRMVFLFVGGGTAKREVEAAAGPTIRSLPYQPLHELRYSLSAADVHLVTVGDAMVGVVHPSKVYGALAVGRPVLLLGPERCHVWEILGGHRIGWRVSHGDVDGAERVLREIASMSPEELVARGRRGRELLAGRLSKAVLCGRFCDVVERGPGEYAATGGVLPSTL